MAFYILINKISESEEEAIYSFYDTAYPDDIGELALNKLTGTTSQLKGTNERFYMRAATKVKKALKLASYQKY